MCIYKTMWLIPANKSCVIKCTCRVGALRPRDHQEKARGSFWREMEEILAPFFVSTKIWFGVWLHHHQRVFFTGNFVGTKLGNFFQLFPLKVAAPLCMPHSQTKKSGSAFLYITLTKLVHKVHNKNLFFFIYIYVN